MTDCIYLKNNNNNKLFEKYGSTRPDSQPDSTCNPFDPWLVLTRDLIDLTQTRPAPPVLPCLTKPPSGLWQPTSSLSLTLLFLSTSNFKPPLSLSLLVFWRFISQNFFWFVLFALCVLFYMGLLLLLLLYRQNSIIKIILPMLILKWLKQDQTQI